MNTLAKRIGAISALAILGTGAAVAAGARYGAQASNAPMTADLERDLDLATSVQHRRTATVSAIEGGVDNKPPSPRRPRTAKPAPRNHAAANQPSATPEPQREMAPDAVSHGAGHAEVAVVAAAVAETPSPAPMPEPMPEGVATAGGPAAPTSERPTDADGTEAAGGRSAGESHGSSRGAGETAGRIIGSVAGVILRGGIAGRDNCRPGEDQSRGGLADIGGILSGGRRMPTGTIPQSGGAPPTRGRRW
jgi:hypothetical protein